MPRPHKLLPSFYRNKFQPGLRPLFPFLLARDREERRAAGENKKSLIEKYKTLSWPHLNFSFFTDLIQLKLSNDLSGESGPLFVSILGGSKTGKSFMFNNLLKKNMAPSGVGTTTHSMLLYFHRHRMEKHFRDRYFPHSELGLNPLKNTEALCDSLSHRIYYLEHENESLADFVLIDTPDFNREDDENVRLAYMALALSDVVLYVFTGDTYADAVGTVVARMAHQCGKIIIPVYNMVDESLMDQRPLLIKDYQEKTKVPQERGDGTVSPPPYPFFPNHFFAVSWLDLRRNPKAFARIEPVNFTSGESCLEILEHWGRERKKEFISQALPLSLTQASKLLDSLSPDLEKVFRELDRIGEELDLISQPMEVEFPLKEAARAIYEIMEGFRPEVVNRFFSGVDKVHEKTIRLAFEWLRKLIMRDNLHKKSPADLSEKRLHQESKVIVEGCVSFADSIRRTGREYGLFLQETLKLLHLESKRMELVSQIYDVLKNEDALAEVKREITVDLSKNPARGFLVYSDVAMRISAVTAAILLTGDGMWMDNLLWGALGDVIGQPLAKMLIGRIGGTRLLNRYKAHRRQRYQEVIEEVILAETVSILRNFPDRSCLETVRNLLTEMESVVRYQ